jgi:hypothetical protein
MKILRMTWKREPTPEEIQTMQFKTAFGPSCFERGREWLFLFGEEPFLHAATPPGYRRIN